MIPNKSLQHKWLQALEKSDIDEGRLHRGQEYAWSGNVEELDINNNEVSAEIEGNYGNYTVEINFKTLNQSQIEQVNEIIESNPDISSEINNGNIPYKLFGLLEEKNIYLIPETFDNYYSDCDCPDDACFCKHIVAVYYAISQKISEKPLLLFVLNGLTVNNPEFKIEKSFKTQAREKLESLLDKADAQILKQIIVNLTFKSKDNYRKCLDIIEDSMPLEDEEKAECSSEKFMTIWNEVKWEIKKIEEYGYKGDYDEEESLEIESKLNEIKEELEKGKAIKKIREEFINDALTYIDTDFGCEILDTIHAACYDKNELRFLAEEIQDSHAYKAMRIYKELADREKYLELRLKNLEDGSDYFDLVKFYKQNGEPDKAITTAYKGLEEGKGNLTTLRMFLSEIAQNSGNREEYLRLQFEETITWLNLEKYKAFKEICSEDEWKHFEPKFLVAVDKISDNEKIRILLERQEYKKALNLLLSGVDTHYKHYTPDTNTVSFNAAEKLETMYPKEIVKFYIDYLGDTNSAKDRKRYAAQAKIAVKIKNTYENNLKTPEKWNEFARNIKCKNKNKPAFQQEFSKVIKNWKEI